MFEDLFLRKKILPKRLEQFGFQKINDRYSFSTDIMHGDFQLTLMFDEHGNVDTELIDKDTGEEYILYKTSAEGAFVGNIRAEICDILTQISNECFEASVFKQEQSLWLIERSGSLYGDELEFLWKTYPNYGVLRRKDTSKWYGVIMSIAKNKLGIASDEIVEVIDLRAATETVHELLTQDAFYAGWHMNKKHWSTVILDGSVNNERLQLVQESYELAVK